MVALSRVNAVFANDVRQLGQKLPKPGVLFDQRVSFVGLFLRFWRDNIWERGDSTWIGRLGDVLANREENLPEVGRYNAGQKIVFWAMSLLILLLFASGIIMWDAYFRDYTTIEMPKNTPTGFVTAFFAVVTGFALIWHIWWMAALGVIGAFATLLAFAFRDQEEIEIPAEKVARFDRAHPMEIAG